MIQQNEIHLQLRYHRKQAEIFEPRKEKIIVIHKGRRFGLTQGYALFALEQMLDAAKEKRKIYLLWVDTVQRNLDGYYERYFTPILSKLPPSIWHFNKQQKNLILCDSQLDMRSAERPELIEGFAYHSIFLNEAGIILRSRYLWDNVIMPMRMDFNPTVYVGGTPKGLGKFNELAINGRGKSVDIHTFHFSSFDNPFLPRAWIEIPASEMPELVRRQEIMGEFIEGESSVFKNVNARINKNLPRLTEPINERTYFAGIDLGKHVDYTVVVILDDQGHMVYFRRFPLGIDWTLQIGEIISILQKFGAHACIDSTGVGDPPLDMIKTRYYAVDGFKFTLDSKPKLIQSLMLTFERGDIELIDEPVLIDELILFGYDVNEKTGRISYSAPEGYHDDCVMALALADYARRNTVYPRFSVL